MSIFDLFSKRKKRERGEVPDVYVYELPEKLRIQIIHLWREALGTPHQDMLHGWNLAARIYWFPICEALQRERGVFRLSKRTSDGPEVEVADYFLNEKDPELALDVVEIVFRFVHFVPEKCQAAIDELNGRFLEHGVGYQYENSRVIRSDSQFLHAAVVKPVLNLLADPAFQGPNDEFLKAHEHYRHKRYKECLTECLKAFESTIKVICDRQRWAYNKTDTASKLIDVCFAKNLIPDYLQAEFSALVAVLKSGVPTVRNKQGGHGQGAAIVTVPPYLASYVLHSTAANILLLVEAEKDLP